MKRIRLSKSDLRRLFGSTNPLAPLKGEGAKPRRPKTPPVNSSPVGRQWAAEQTAKNNARRIFVAGRFKNPTNTIAQGGAFWAARREVDRVRATVAAECRAFRVSRKLPVRVSITRLSAGTLDAHDNLRTALKPVADGVADYFETKNDVEGFAWIYDQSKAPAGCGGVIVEFSPNDPF